MKAYSFSGLELRQFFLVCLLLFVPLLTQAQTKSGIAEIDSLPLNDWAVPNPPLSYSKALAFSILPGGAQFYGGHYVRGSFLVGMETLLLGLGLATYFSDIPKWGDDLNGYLDSADASYLTAIRSENAISQRNAQNATGKWIALARERASLRIRQADLANSQLAWAAGLHLYGLLDGQEIIRNSQVANSGTRSARTAMWRGMLFPGGGQLYNNRYGKFGMLWMVIGASGLSAWSRQEVVEYLNDVVRVARIESKQGVIDAQELKDLETDRTLYRKRRNQYYWGIAFFYAYGILDGMVDAALSDFDHPDRFALVPGNLPLSFEAQIRF